MVTPSCEEHIKLLSISKTRQFFRMLPGNRAELKSLSSLLLSSLQSGMNLQICFVNDSGSDKDSDADDSKTETSLDTPLSPMVSPKAAIEAQNVLSWASAFFSHVSQEETLKRLKKKCDIS